MKTITKGRGVRAKTHQEWVEPRYSIAWWSLNSRVAENLARTNNFVEAWNKQFSDGIHSHPGVYQFVDYMRKEQKLTENKVVKLRTGVRERGRRPEYDHQDERLQKIVELYKRDDFFSFYSNLSLILKY